MGRYDNNRKIFSLLVLLLTFFYLIQIIGLSKYPNEIKIPIGENRNLEIPFPFSLVSLNNEDNIVQSIYIAIKYFRFNSGKKIRCKCSR